MTNRFPALRYWIEAWVRYGARSGCSEGIGSFLPSEDGSFQLVLQEPDGWTGVYDSEAAAVSVSTPH